MIIPPRYAYSAIAAFAIGATAVLYVTMPPLPQPRQQTAIPISAAEQQQQRQDAEAATAAARAEEEMYARARDGGAATSAARRIYRDIHGTVSPELIGRCIDAGHSRDYCNRQ